MNDHLVNLVLLRELRIDPLLKDKLSPHIKMNSVRNRDRQDVESLAEIGAPEVCSVLAGVKQVTHTFVPEKFRVCDDNKQGILQQPRGICAGPMCNIFVSDQARGVVLKVRASHYPADIEQILSGLKSPTGLTYDNGIVFVAESGRGQIVLKDITGETILNPDAMSLAKLKAKLKQPSLWKAEYGRYRKTQLKVVLKSYLSQECNSKGKSNTSVLELQVPVKTKPRKPVYLHAGTVSDRTCCSLEPCVDISCAVSYSQMGSQSQLPYSKRSMHLWVLLLVWY